MQAEKREKSLEKAARKQRELEERIREAQDDAATAVVDEGAKTLHYL